MIKGIVEVMLLRSRLLSVMNSLQPLQITDGYVVVPHVTVTVTLSEVYQPMPKDASLPE